MATGGHYITMLLADIMTWSSCPPVSMVKEAMESIYSIRPMKLIFEVKVYWWRWTICKWFLPPQYHKSILHTGAIVCLQSFPGDNSCGRHAPFGVGSPRPDPYQVLESPSEIYRPLFSAPIIDMENGYSADFPSSRQTRCSRREGAEGQGWEALEKRLVSLLLF